MAGEPVSKKVSKVSLWWRESREYTRHELEREPPLSQSLSRLLLKSPCLVALPPTQPGQHFAMAEILLVALALSSSSLILPTRLSCQPGIRPALIARHAALRASGDDPDATDPNCAARLAAPPPMRLPRTPLSHIDRSVSGRYTAVDL